MTKNFTFKFQKAPRAEPVRQNDIRVPNFSDKSVKMDAHSFVLWGDASNVDLSDAGEVIKYIRFANDTVFPSKDKMPDGFNPEQEFQEGLNPGLHVRDLHALGITGKNITVAIIDQPLNTEHVEIKDNIVHYESIGYPEYIEASYHGTAVSSILAGKTLGVAPDAKIVYFAAKNVKNNSAKVFAEQSVKEEIERYLPKDIKYEDFVNDIENNRYVVDKQFKEFLFGIMQSFSPELVKRIQNAKSKKEPFFDNYAAALRKILFMNARLPENQKISAVSISWGGLGMNEECSNLIKQLIESGVMVLTTDSHRFYDKNADFITMDRQMNMSADDIESYDAGFWKDEIELVNNKLLAPAGGRTVAGFYDDNHYIYCGADSGMSWSTPYLVGVYALAKQVMPTLTPQHFFDVAHRVGASNDKIGKNVIVQPQKIIEYLQNEKILQNTETKGR